MTVRNIAFTAYPANDVAATRRWYEQKLGLRFGSPYIEDDVEQYNEALIGSGYFSLMSAPWTKRTSGSASSLYLEVDNVDDMVDFLESNDVVIDERFAGPVCKQASFCDPEGNWVTIHESYARRSSPDEAPVAASPSTH